MIGLILLSSGWDWFIFNGTRFTENDYGDEMNSNRKHVIEYSKRMYRVMEDFLVWFECVFKPHNLWYDKYKDKGGVLWYIIYDIWSVGSNSWKECEGSRGIEKYPLEIVLVCPV